MAQWAYHALDAVEINVEAADLREAVGPSEVGNLRACIANARSLLAVLAENADVPQQESPIERAQLQAVSDLARRSVSLVSTADTLDDDGSTGIWYFGVSMAELIANSLGALLLSLQAIAASGRVVNNPGEFFEGALGDLDMVAPYIFGALSKLAQEDQLLTGQ